jgi:hypothetical protein
LAVAGSNGSIPTSFGATIQLSGATNIVNAASAVKLAALGVTANDLHTITVADNPSMIAANINSLDVLPRGAALRLYGPSYTVDLATAAKLSSLGIISSA